MSTMLDTIKNAEYNIEEEIGMSDDQRKYFFQMLNALKIKDHKTFLSHFFSDITKTSTKTLGNVEIDSVIKYLEGLIKQPEEQKKAVSERYSEQVENNNLSTALLAKFKANNSSNEAFNTDSNTVSVPAEEVVQQTLIETPVNNTSENISEEASENISKIAPISKIEEDDDEDGYFLAKLAESQTFILNFCNRVSVAGIKSGAKELYSDFYNVLDFLKSLDIDDTCKLDTIIETIAPVEGIKQGYLKKAEELRAKAEVASYIAEKLHYTLQDIVEANEDRRIQSAKYLADFVRTPASLQIIDANLLPDDFKQYHLDIKLVDSEVEEVFNARIYELFADDNLNYKAIIGLLAEIKEANASIVKNDVKAYIKDQQKLVEEMTIEAEQAKLDAEVEAKNKEIEEYNANLSEGKKPKKLLKPKKVVKSKLEIPEYTLEGVELEQGERFRIA